MLLLLSQTTSSTSALTAPVATILAALIAAFFGSLMGHFLIKRRELQSREQDAGFKHLQRQLEEFYGPLAGLVRESKILYETACEILPTVDGKRAQIDTNKFRDGDIIRWRFFIETYWFPINQQIIQLLRTKVYLLEEEQMPPSFLAFIRHAAAFEALHRLWKEQGQETNKEVKGVGWPMQFEPDVEASLLSLKKKYDEYRGIHHRPPALVRIAEKNVV